MVRHPYREPGLPPEPALPPSKRLGDDLDIAVMLLLVGALSIGIGLCTDGTTELSVGLLLIALAAKVAYDGRPGRR